MGRCQVVVGKNLFHKIPLNSNDQIRCPNSSLKTGIWHFPIPAAYIHSLHWLNRIYVSFVPFHSFLIVWLVYGHGFSSPVFLLHSFVHYLRWPHTLSVALSCLSILHFTPLACLSVLLQGLSLHGLLCCSLFPDTSCCLLHVSSSFLYIYAAFLYDFFPFLMHPYLDFYFFLKGFVVIFS